MTERRDLWAMERALRAEGFRLICGCDEAGAGPLAGAVYAAAVILPSEADLPGLDDSKKLTEKKREALYEVITTQAVSWSVTRVEAWEIDEMDILNARMLAMTKATLYASAWAMIWSKSASRRFSVSFLESLRPGS